MPTMTKDTRENFSTKGNTAQDLLLMQRKLVFDDLHLHKKSFHTLIIATLTFSIAITMLFGDVNSKIKYNEYILFICIQLIIFLLFFLLVLLFGMNSKREYIHAIDTYLQERYGIYVLFYQGILSKKHTTDVRSSFSSLTYAFGISAFFSILGIIIGSGVQILSKISVQGLEWFIITLLATQATIFLGFVAWNCIYKITGKSKVYGDALEYLRKSEEYAKKWTAPSE